MLSEHVRGTKALDFGCGTGRSTRFLNELGFAAIGVDIADEMIRQARSIDPSGDYRLVEEGDLGQFGDEAFDLVLSAFTFDNIPTLEKKVEIFAAIKRILKKDGKLINLVSSPEIYCHEWASFSTIDFPENKVAKCGDRVKIIITDIDDSRPVEDIVWPDEDYREVYRRVGMEPVGYYRPLGKENEPVEWVNEETIPPWVIYVLRKVNRPLDDTR
jgi:ubiquinone/menaquinone biosynthesis C-methylase UbiE